MCGIAGSLPFGRTVPLRDAVQRMTRAMFLRGPDDGDVWVDDAAGVALGHRRLAVLDLSPAGHQPMVSACGRYVVVFNGEIYNHQELRDELHAISAAPQWRGHSDTETLLAAIAAWGLKGALQRSVGMFALALWDREERRLMLARDRVGEKPLYYGQVAGAFVFASELKAIRAYPGFDATIDRDALNLYFQYTVIPAPRSIYQGIHKLEPGHILSVGPDPLTSPQRTAYWSLLDEAESARATGFTDEADAIRTLEDDLRRAIRAQSVADVPLGAFLSGGVDSSTIVALMQAQASRPVQTFTIGFDESGFDEAPYAREVARHLGTDHHEMRVRPADAEAVIPLLPSMYDEPFADSSQIPTHLVCKAARRSVTVALSGDGGDELFGGYTRYARGRQIWRQIAAMPYALRHVLGSGATSLSHEAWDRIGAILPMRAKPMHFGSKVHRVGRHLKSIRRPIDLHRTLVTEWPADCGIAIGSHAHATRLDDLRLPQTVDDLESRMMLWDTLSYLPDDILTKVDRAAMGVSLETRAPFLDHRVIRTAWRLPVHMKLRGTESKWALRQVLYKYVPRELIERPKAGFMVPVGEWLRGPLRDWAEGLIDERRLKEEGYLNPDVVRATWAQHRSGTFNWTARLWAVLMFQAWLDEGRSTSSPAP